MSGSCRLGELRCREVISLCDGTRLGFVGDAVLTLPEGRVQALIVPGRRRFFGLLGCEEDIVIPWEDIERLGGDVILVRCARPCLRPAPRHSLFSKK